MRFIFVQDRETDKWFYAGIVPFRTRTEYISVRSNRTKKISYQPDYVYPKPENISAFVKSHKIIESESKEEAWQILN